MRSSPGKAALDAAVEEVRHVRVLLGLGQAQVLDAGVRPDVGEDVGERPGAGRRPEGRTLLVFGEATEEQPGRFGRGNSANAASAKRARQLARAVRPEVEEDDRVAVADRADGLAVRLTVRTVGWMNSSVSPRA